MWSVLVAAVCYRPPGQEEEVDKVFVKELEETSHTYALVLMEDFNVHDYVLESALKGVTMIVFVMVLNNGKFCFVKEKFFRKFKTFVTKHIIYCQKSSMILFSWTIFKNTKLGGEMRFCNT